MILSRIQRWEGDWVGWGWFILESFTSGRHPIGQLFSRPCETSWWVSFYFIERQVPTSQNPLLWLVPVLVSGWPDQGLMGGLCGAGLSGDQGSSVCCWPCSVEREDSISGLASAALNSLLFGAPLGRKSRPGANVNTEM